MTGPLCAMVEAGGTKFVLGIGTGPDDVRATTRIATTDPVTTIAAMVDWFAQQAPFAAIGIASFGPLDIRRSSARWGHITATTKPGWSDTDLVGPLIQRFGCPVGFDTDVNGAALGEYIWGAGHSANGSSQSLVYLTVGTGIGGGAIVDGRILHGLSHPEMGHIRIARHVDDVGFAGTCPFHGDCLEGLASGPAILARWGASLSDLAPDHPAHTIIAYYLGQAVVTLQSILEPELILIGGGVMATPGLLPRVHAAAADLGRGYFVGDPSCIVKAPGLGDRAGLLGALALAQRALSDQAAGGGTNPPRSA